MSVNVFSTALLRVSASLSERGALIKIAGDLDVESAPLLDNALNEVVQAGAAHVVLDISQLGFIGSAGVQCILRGVERLEEAGSDLVVRSPGPMALKVFSICGVPETLVER